MTLRDFFEWMAQTPQYVTGYFIALPILALLINWIANGVGHQAPWRYFYGALIYAVCIPGIITIAFNLYLFLFQRKDIMDTNILAQILPVISMFLTLWLIKRNVQYDDIPGFDKMSVFLTIIAVVLLLLWFIDKVHIYSFTYVPLWQMILIFVVLILVIRYSLRRIL